MCLVVPQSPGALPRGRDRRARARRCAQTSLASGITLTRIPQSCLPPALPSRGEGVAGPGLAWPQYDGATATVRRPERRRGSSPAGASGAVMLPSLRTVQSGAPSAREVGERGPRDGEKPWAGDAHSLPPPPRDGRCLSGRGHRLCTDLGFMLRPSSVSCLI